MHHAYLPFLISLLLLALLPAQRLDNLRWEQAAPTALANYDILDAKAGQTFEMDMMASNDGSLSPCQRGVWNSFADAPQWVGECLVNGFAKVTGGDDMALVKGGSFRMGDSFGDGESDQEVHTVRLSSYYMGTHEITVQQFYDFVSASGYTTTAEAEGTSWVYNFRANEWEESSGVSWRNDALGKLRPQADYQHPVLHVSWFDAVHYCNWRSRQEGLTPCYTISGESVSCNFKATGYRLPTEAEWEYAARSRGKKYKYAWGNGSPSGANLLDETGAAKFNFDGTAENMYVGYTDGYVATAPVGALGSANELGLFDMTGNVWEWCWDWYAEYPTRASTNPTGPNRGSDRTLRGGSWDGGPRSCRVSFRNYITPESRGNRLGFRLARTR